MSLLDIANARTSDGDDDPPPLCDVRLANRDGTYTWFQVNAYGQLDDVDAEFALAIAANNALAPDPERE